MRKNIFKIWLMALPMLLGLAACAEHDNPTDPNPLAKQVSGLWWTLIDSKGTLPDEFEGFDYTRMGMAYQLNEDGTGYGVAFFFNDEQGDPIQIIGGEGWAPMTYTTTQDGRIIPDFGDAYKAYGDFYKQFNATYRDGVVTATNGTLTLTLEHPSDAMAAKIHEWDYQFNGGVEMDTFNPNDVDFNLATWRQQPGIYIYDGVGPKIINHDGAQYRFTIVELPWNKTATSSNLPMNFCDDITPENGWDLVMNYCGNTSETNRNFFALYNKWTGVLRFFTYVPKGFDSGNDHLWQVMINGQTGMRQGLPYGLPLDKTVVDPSAIDMDIDGSSRFVSPWVSKRSTDGLITPRAGWWAFDVDMSQYQPGLDISSDMIRLQMVSWTKQNVTLFSEMMADLDGNISAEIKTQLTNTASQLNTANETMQIITSIGAIIGNAYQGNVGLIFTNYGNMTDHMFTLAGKNKSKTTFEGSINMTMKGNITTSGILEKSDPVTGVSSPTISFSEFDTKNTQLGRGIWNLKTSPVVWLTNGWAYFELLSNFWQNYNSDMVYYYTGNGHAFQYYPDNTSFYFFDPSSIEVELNPDLFPASQVEWTQVEAYCVSRSENAVKGTDNYRKAFGLNPRVQTSQNYSQKSISDPKAWQMDFRHLQNVFDFLYYADDKLGMEYPSVVCTPKYAGGWMYDVAANGYYDAVVGRGKAGSVAIEPMLLSDGRNNDESEMGYRTPALEVMVYLLVKVKGQSEPYVYVRHYLPEIKLLPLTKYDEASYKWVVPSELNQVWQNIKARQPKGTGINRQSPAYDYEMQRIGKILNFLNPDFKAE